MYDVSPEFLTQLGFNEYFSALAEWEGPISNGIQPPPNSKDIFMGCGHIYDSHLKMGIIVKPEELFDQQSYPHNADTEAKKVKNFYTYYDNGAYEPIGFSGTPVIHLYHADTYDDYDTTKMSAHTTGFSSSFYILIFNTIIDFSATSLWRCGALTDKPGNFDTTYKLVFYNRL